MIVETGQESQPDFQLLRSRAMRDIVWHCEEEDESMELEAFEKLVAQTREANAQTEHRLLIAAEYGVAGDDHEGRRREAHIAWLQGDLVRRDWELADAACRIVTGQSWDVWCAGLGQGPAAGYRPSIDGAQFGLAASVMAEAWQARYGSEAYVYGMDKNRDADLTDDEADETDAPTFRH